MRLESTGANRMKPHRLLELTVSAPALACVIFLCSVAIHAPFTLFESFGEQDAARIAASSVYGFHVGFLKLGKQWPFSCPLYIQGAYWGLKAGLFSPGSVIFVMALSSLVASALVSALLFVFFLRATESKLAAIAVAIVVQLCPFFWMNSLYGFPTMVSLGLFMISVAIFQQVFLSAPSRTKSIIGYSSAWIFYVAAVFTKVDSLLASAILCLPVWQSRRTLPAKLIWTGALAVASFATFWLFNRYGLSLSQYQDVGSHWREWSDTFYLGFAELFSTQNTEVIARAAGVASIPAAGLGAALGLTDRRLRFPVLWLALAFVPAVFFWSLIGGNSARHNLIPSFFVSALLALPLASKKKWLLWTWIPVLAVTLWLNYSWFPPSSSTVKPSGRLLESAALLKKSADTQAQKAREITRMPEDKIAILGPSHLQPYYYFEVIANDRFEFVKKGGGKYYVRDGQKEKLFYIPPSLKSLSVRKLQKDGFRVVKIPR